MRSGCNSLSVKRFRSMRALDDERVHQFEATKGVEDIIKFVLIYSEGGRLFLIYVNELGELHGIYHVDWYLQ